MHKRTHTYIVLYWFYSFGDLFYVFCVGRLRVKTNMVGVTGRGIIHVKVWINIFHFTPWISPMALIELFGFFREFPLLSLIAVLKQPHPSCYWLPHWQLTSWSVHRYSHISTKSFNPGVYSEHYSFPGMAG